MSILNALGFDTKRITNESLRRLNLLAAALHTLQAAAVLLLSDNSSGSKPVTTGYLTKDNLASDGVGDNILISATRHLFDLNMVYLIAGLFILGAIFHILAATRLRRNYEQNIKAGVNKPRWIEYSLSAGVITLAVALLAGISDLSLLILAFGATSAMGIAALITEKHTQDSKSSSALTYWLGVGLGVLPLVVLLIYILSALIYGNGVPTFVYFIFSSLILLFTSFAINVYLQQRKMGLWKNYIYGERNYIVISLVVKSLIAWQIFAGLLR